jgi:hypothetical protein
MKLLPGRLLLDGSGLIQTEMGCRKEMKARKKDPAIIFRKIDSYDIYWLGLS